jgi:hypothetical protein
VFKSGRYEAAKAVVPEIKPWQNCLPVDRCFKETALRNGLVERAVQGKGG